MRQEHSGILVADLRTEEMRDPCVKDGTNMGKPAKEN
jgi:hypothetical protein